MNVKRLDNVKVAPGLDEGALKAAAAKKLGLRENAFSIYKILRKSIDARDKTNVKYVYSLAIETGLGKGLPDYRPGYGRIADIPKARPKNPPKVLIVGAGPAGLYAALTLLEAGVKPVLIDRGGGVDERENALEKLRKSGILDGECNVQYGVGGAGLFSDGKLNSGISNELFSAVFGELHAFGAPEEILYSAMPHVGTDVLRTVLKNAVKVFTDGGGELRTGTKLSDIRVENGKFIGAELGNGDYIAADAMMTAIGHSAFDTFKMLRKRGLYMEPKPFSIGVRIEHPQDMINRARYGKFAEILPPAYYKEHAVASDGRGVYSFCMCPGGEVIVSSSEPDTLVTNGMSNYMRDGRNANSAILVSVTPRDFGTELFGGFTARACAERAAFIAGGGGYYAPVQYYGNLIGKPIADRVEPTALPGVREADLKEYLPEFVVKDIAEGIMAFSRHIPGFDMSGAVLTGVESRSSCPVRIVRDEGGESNIRGIYPIGEGAGYAGGITSSAVDGVKAALKLLSKFGK